MRIVVWNANMAVRKKLDALTALAPDLAIVSECESTVPTRDGVSFAWVGRNPHKGLGIFAFGDYHVALDESF